MASKFVLLTAMARYFTPSDVGIYGLMVVTIANCAMLAGMQFFLYANRSLAAAAPRAGLVAVTIRNQFVFYGLLYLLVLPLFLWVFVTGALPWPLAVWFYSLVVVEHISYELQRILANLARPIRSNVIHTIRTGVWVYLLLALILGAPSLRDVRTLWCCWLAGSLASVALGLYWLRNLEWASVWRTPVDWPWIKSGCVTTLHYIPTTLVLFLSTTVDRYTLDHFVGKPSVGAYTFFASVTNVVVSFPEAGIATVMVPQIISAFAEGRFQEHARLLKDFARKLAWSIVLTSAGAILAVLLALEYYVREPIYKASLNAFWLLLLSSGLTTLSLWPHHSLYSRNLDKPLVGVGLIAVVPFIILNLTLIPRFGIMGAACAALTMQAIMFLGKLALSRRFVVQQQP